MPCDSEGNFLPPNTPPPPPPAPSNDWFPYRDQQQFELADFLYHRNEMTQSQVDQLLDIIAAIGLSENPDYQPPFANHQDLFETINATPNGSVDCDSFTVSYCGSLLKDGTTPLWMKKEYEVWFRNVKKVVANMLANKDFDGEFDYVPYREFDGNGERIFKELFSGDWAQKHAVGSLNIANFLLTKI